MIATATVNGIATSARVLSREQMFESAPSIFAETPWAGMSSRYKFIPTIEVVDMLGDRGFRPILAFQSLTRIPGRSDFTKHVVRFRHDDHLASHVGDELPELVLVNSHDGKSAYQFMSGVFRVVCSNGMIVQSADFGSISVRHSGPSEFRDRVDEATCRTAEHAPQVAARIAAWKQIELKPQQAEAFAEAAIEVRDGTIEVTPRQLLATRRQADKAADLWTTSNVVQENLVRGGLRGRGATGKRATTRPIKSVGEDVRLNRALWALTERMAQLVS